MILRKRFSDVVSRQLDLFVEVEGDGLLAEVRKRKASYDRADRDDAEEAYGDYVDAVDAVRDALEEMRDRFAKTLADDALEEYEAAFDRAAQKRWRWLG
ncbi:MAG: hypothetical protein JOY72_10230 [Actinobacteria bacterium]|nr:hypothetical protein [Actinomycetota bacterium]MBV8599584.1 hypothetical protein [Actinomycetota bacterium]